MHADIARPRRVRILALILAVCISICVYHPGIADARPGRVGLFPGMKLRFGPHVCSLGFLASNANGDRLAVTAGHCSAGTGERVKSNHYNPIGVVVTHAPDDFSHRHYGVTVIHLARNTYTKDPYFTHFGDPQPGDFVAKYGERTQKTTGSITFSDAGELHSNVISLPGDSGGPWVSYPQHHNKLIGIEIGHNANKNDGSHNYSIGYGIDELVAGLRQHGGRWGTGFLPAGRPQ